MAIVYITSQNVDSPVSFGNEIRGDDILLSLLFIGKAVAELEFQKLTKKKVELFMNPVMGAESVMMSQQPY